MKSSGSLLLAFLPALLAAGTQAPIGAPTPPPPPAESAPPPPPPPPATSTAASPNRPASDYTADAAQTPLVPEFDPNAGPPPPYAEPSDEDGLRECVGPDGVPIFTDRRCGDLGATPKLAPPAPMGEGLASPVRVRTCARNQTMLLDGVRAALESHDANRLAEFYHWTGMDSTQGYRMMERLDAFSARQVVDVRLVRAALPDAPPDPYGDRFDPLPLPEPPGVDDAAAPGAPTDPSAAPPRAARRPLASLLRVDQMRSADDVSANVTYFHLLTNAGCWWMRF
jgi:hypothetical protein